MKDTLKDTRQTLLFINKNVDELISALRIIKPLVSDDGAKYIIENVRLDLFSANSSIEKICKNIDRALAEPEPPTEEEMKEMREVVGDD